MTIAPVPVDEAPCRAPRPDGLDDDDAARPLPRHGPRARVRGGGGRGVRRGPDPGSTHPCIGQEGDQGRRARHAPAGRPRPRDLPRPRRGAAQGRRPGRDDGRADGPRDRHLQGQGRLDAPFRPVRRPRLDERDRRRATSRWPAAPPSSCQFRGTGQVVALLLRRRRLVRGRVLRDAEHGDALEACRSSSSARTTASRSRCRRRRARRRRTSPTARAASACRPRSSTATTCSRSAMRSPRPSSVRGRAAARSFVECKTVRWERHSAFSAGGTDPERAAARAGSASTRSPLPARARRLGSRRRGRPSTCVDVDDAHRDAGGTGRRPRPPPFPAPSPSTRTSSRPQPGLVDPLGAAGSRPRARRSCRGRRGVERRVK